MQNGLLQSIVSTLGREVWTIGLWFEYRGDGTFCGEEETGLVETCGGCRWISWSRNYRLIG